MFYDIKNKKDIFFLPLKEIQNDYTKIKNPTNKILNNNIINFLLKNKIVNERNNKFYFQGHELFLDY